MLRVKGTGFVAKLVRSILGGFDIRERVKTTWSNEGILWHTTYNNLIDNSSSLAFMGKLLWPVPIQNYFLRYESA
jgi:hypothetical protein